MSAPLLTIVVTPDGQMKCEGPMAGNMTGPALLIWPTNDGVNVAGPVGNIGLAYAMLEMAKDVVRKANDTVKAERRIIPANGPLR
jgi:hypothetical protein